MRHLLRALLLVAVLVPSLSLAAGPTGGPKTPPALIPGTVNDCVKYVTPTQGGPAGTSCGGSATPVIFVGNTAGSANTYTIASPTPTGFTLTDQYVVCGTISATNTGASTLNVNSTGATAIKKQTQSGLTALTGGELVANNTQYCFQYNATGTAWVLTTTLGTGVSKDVSAHTVTAAEWANWQLFVFATSQTLTLPVATSLATNGGIIIVALGNVTVTLTPNSADGFNGGTINTSVTLPGNVFTTVTTTGASGANAFQVPRGDVAGTNITLTRNANGTTTIDSTASGSGDYIKISAQTGSNSTALNFTSIGTYASYRLVCTNLLPQTAADSAGLQFSEDGGSSYIAANYRYAEQYINTVAELGNINADPTASIVFTNTIKTSGMGASTVIDIDKLSSSSAPKSVSFDTRNLGNDDKYYRLHGSGWYTGDSNAVNALRVKFGSQNVASGTCTLYGLN